MYWNNIYLWPMIAAGLIALGVCLYIWPRRQAVGAGLLMAMILAVAEWSFAYALEYGWPTLTLKAIAVKLEYIGITAIPPLWLAFTLRYTGKERWVTGRNVLLLAIFPALTLLFVWTNEYHGLLWSRVWLVATESFPRLAFRRGVWFWVWTGLAYLQLAAGSIILVVANLRTPKLYRKQIGIVLLGALFPWLSNAIYLGGLSPVPFLDLTPFAFTLTGLLWTWSLFRYRLMDLAPIAHQVVIEGLSEAVIVLDHLDRLVDANLKARELMNLPEAEAVGRPIQELIPETTHLLKGELPIRDVVAELDSGPDRERRWYEIRVSGLTDTRLRPVGKVIILYDITNLKETENALKASEERYRLTVDKSQSGIVLIDDASRIIYANPEFGRIVGYSPEEVLNRNFQDFLAEESREMTAERYRDRQAGRAVPDRYTIRLVRRDGVKRTIELSAVVFRETTGRVQSMAQLMDVTERETAMTALQESENRYRTIFEQSRDVIYLSRPDGEVVEFNQAAVDLLGYTREEYLLLGDGKAYLDPEQRVRQMAELEEKGFIKDYEIGLRCRDGSEIVCLDTATVWRDEEGRIKGYIGTLRDVTESKMAEQALRESEERYQRILEASQDPMVLCGMDQRVIYLNPSFTRIFGWTMEELRGRRSDFVPERYLQETLEMGAEVDRGESFSGFETRRYNKAGRLVDISLSAAVFRDREGNPLGSVINLRDVTRRKRAEEAVRESEEKFRNITSNALDGIIMVDPAGLISFWNEAAERMFGYSGQEVLGRDLHLLLAPEKYHDRYREAFQSFQAEGRGRSVGRTLELTALKKGGEEIPIEISISSLWSRDQWHALGVVRDIGERKRAEAERERLEAQLRQAQKMEAVGNLASGVAHDFNNLLQGIGGYSQLIMALKEIDEKALHYAAEIDGAAQRATDLVTRLLTFGRKVEPELKPVDLNGPRAPGGRIPETDHSPHDQDRNPPGPGSAIHRGRRQSVEPGPDESGRQRPRRHAGRGTAAVRDRKRRPGRKSGRRQSASSRGLRAVEGFGQRGGD